MSKVAEKRRVLTDSVLEIAERQIAGGGLSALNMREIAAEAGCSVGTLYNLFDGLDGIILLVNSRTLARLNTHLSSTADAMKDGTPSERLVALAHSYLDFVIANRKVWGTLFEHQMPNGEPIPEWHLQEHLQLFRHIVLPLSEISPEKTEEDMLMLARNVYSAVHGIVSLGLQDRMRKVPTDVLKDQLQLIVESFVAGYTLLWPHGPLAHGRNGAVDQA